MKLQFTLELDRAKTLSENEAITYMNKRFSDGEHFMLNWDNGYSYCGCESANEKSGEEVVNIIKNLITKKHGENPPVEKYALCGWSGYLYGGYCCDKNGRFIIRMNRNGKRWSEVSDS